MGKKMSNLESIPNDKIKLEISLASSTKLLIVFSQLVCACPVNLQPNPKNMITYLLSTLAHLALAIFYFTLIICTAYARYLTSLDTVSFMVRILNVVEYLFNITNCSIMIIGCIIIVKYFNNIIEIDLASQRVSDRPYFCTLKSHLNKMLLSLLILNSVYLCTVLLYQKDLFKTAQVLILNALPNIITFLSVFQYTALLYVLQERYKQINIIIKSLSDTSTATKKPRKTNKFEISLADDSFQMKSKAMNYDAIYITEKINSVQAIYHDLQELERNVCESFGILAISLFTSGFIIVCSQLYALYTIIQELDQVNWLTVFYKIMWVCSHSVKVILMLLRNGKLIEEVCISSYYINYFLLSARF